MACLTAIQLVSIFKISKNSKIGFLTFLESFELSIFASEQFYFFYFFEFVVNTFIGNYHFSFLIFLKMKFLTTSLSEKAAIKILMSVML